MLFIEHISPFDRTLATFLLHGVTPALSTDDLHSIRGGQLERQYEGMSHESDG
jgi:hypothetical protein